ncbi:MAG: cation transporter [Chloroflexi bacterium]|nr:cation transporter [Chloroflexota bacterium]
MHNHAGHDQTGHLQSRMRFAVLLTGAVLIGELLGGYLSNSLALMSDAGHVFTDFLALTLSWFGVVQAAKPPSARMTFGYHRIGIVIALGNALSIILIAVVIFYEAYQRLQAPPAVESLLMLGVALIGLTANLVVVGTLHREQQESLNVRSAFLHAAGDALASVAVIVGGLVILFTGWYWVDPVISVAIGLVIALAAWPIIKEAMAIILEASPSGIDAGEVIADMKSVPGVKEIHDLHVWAIAPRINALSSHVIVDDQHVSEGEKIVQELKAKLGAKYSLGHWTIQLECENCEEGEHHED